MAPALFISACANCGTEKGDILMWAGVAFIIFGIIEEGIKDYIRNKE
jgi:hypothetical protein